MNRRAAGQVCISLRPAEPVTILTLSVWTSCGNRDFVDDRLAGVASALGMYTFLLAEFTTLGTLRDRAPLPLHLEQWTFGVVA